MTFGAISTSLAKRLGLCIALALGVTTTGFADSGRHGPTIHWRLGLLGIDADRVPLRELLLTIAKRTGTEVRGIDVLSGSASIRFADHTLRSGLEAVLAQFNYAMFNVSSVPGGEGHLVVIVVGEKSHASSTSIADSGRGDTQATLELDAAYVPDAYQAVERLAELGNVPALRDAAMSGDPTTRALSMQRLRHLDPETAMRIATDAFRTDDATERALAVQMLGGLDNADATTTLGIALMDPEVTVRQAAVVGLMGQQSPAATRVLERALQDEAESIRSFVRELLSRRNVFGTSERSQ